MSDYGHRLIPPPVWWPPMRAGETDSRYLDFTPDLGPAGDSITAIGTVSVVIARQDGAAVTGADLVLAGVAWPNTLDATGLIPTFGLHAPSGSAGVAYAVAITVAGTAKGRTVIRDVLIAVAGALG
jgi:hypothetical protein